MRNLRRILIVDDDAALRQSLAEQLELHAEFASLQCDSAAAALGIIGQERFDAVLLDVGLPDMDGHELCREMRRAGITVPIVMLTAADSEADTVLGLDAGANDYVTKPFRLSVLLARLRAHLRQSELNDDAVLTIGPYTFRPSAKLMTDTGGKKKVRLTE
jgi:DNA-binding response OmpR family regulator